jgi:hypothetical protein
VGASVTAGSSAEKVAVKTDATEANSDTGVGAVEDKVASGGDAVEEIEVECEEDRMVQCNECARWVHALCEGIDQAQYESMTRGTHPVWVSINIITYSRLLHASCFL